MAHLSRTVFVGSLNFRTEVADLRFKCEKFGKVRSVEIIKDDEGKSLGFGYVEFEKPQDAEYAISQLDDTMLDGKIIHLEFSKPSLRRKMMKKYEEKLAIQKSRLEKESKNSPKPQNERVNSPPDNRAIQGYDDYTPPPPPRKPKDRDSEGDDYYSPPPMKSRSPDYSDDYSPPPKKSIHRHHHHHHHHHRKSSDPKVSRESEDASSKAPIPENSNRAPKDHHKHKSHHRSHHSRSGRHSSHRH